MRNTFDWDTFIRLLAILLKCMIRRCNMVDESAKLRALRAHMPTCLACLLAHVPTCLRALRDYVLTCLACVRAHVPTCLACLGVYVATYLACLGAHVPTCLPCFGAHVPTCSRAITTNNKNKFSIICFPYMFVIVLSFFFLWNKAVVHSCIALTRREPLTGAMTNFVL